MIVTVTNPDAPFDSPAYDGEPADAHKHLAPGTYGCSYLDEDDRDQSGYLVVVEGQSRFVADDPWTDANDNQYDVIPAAKDIPVGAQIMLSPGTYYTVEDTAGYADDEMDPQGTIAVATDVDGERPVYGKVASVEPVGELVLITLAAEQSAPWAFSIPALQFVYAA